MQYILKLNEKFLLFFISKLLVQLIICLLYTKKSLMILFNN